ncbi:MAG: uroporphyrinogen decarboxylase family protein [Clostridia bacterium]
MWKEYCRSALNMEMTDKVCRTEYSVFQFPDLIKKVTEGMDPETFEAKREFAKRWDIGVQFGTDFHGDKLGGMSSSMGHAEYAVGGKDRNDHISQLFEDPEDALDFDPEASLPHYEHQFLVDYFNDKMTTRNTTMPNLVNMTGTYITLMSGMIAMLGWDTLLSAAGIDLDGFGELVNRYTKWMQHQFDALAKIDSEFIAVHDDTVWTEGPFISPDWYRKYIFPNYKKLFEPILNSGKKIVYVCDGNYTQFVGDVAECGVTSFVHEPFTDLSYIAEKYGKTHSFVGNADTRVLLFGTKEDIYNEVKRCMDIGKKYPGFIMAVGNHIPPNTPIDSCLYYDEYCKKLGKR